MHCQNSLTNNTVALSAKDGQGRFVDVGTPPRFPLNGRSPLQAAFMRGGTLGVVRGC